MTSIVFLMEKKRVCTSAGAAMFNNCWRIVSSEIASFATKIKLAPKEPFHCVAT